MRGLAAMVLHLLLLSALLLIVLYNGLPVQSFTSSSPVLRCLALSQKVLLQMVVLQTIRVPSYFTWLCNDAYSYYLSPGRANLRKPVIQSSAISLVFHKCFPVCHQCSTKSSCNICHNSCFRDIFWKTH